MSHRTEASKKGTVPLMKAEEERKTSFKKDHQNKTENLKKPADDHQKYHSMDPRNHCFTEV